jgi:hypothetical protein
MTTTADRLRAAEAIRLYRETAPSREATADALAADLYLLDGLSLTAVAGLVGLSKTEMYRRLTAQGVVLRPRGRPRKT